MTMHDLRVPPGRTYRYHRSPLYPFGAGLSLTQWELSGVRPACLNALATASTETCNLTLHVTNVGSRAGDCVVTAYFRSGATHEEWQPSSARFYSCLWRSEEHTPSKHSAWRLVDTPARALRVCACGECLCG
jgi:hypothetical protein